MSDVVTLLRGPAPDLHKVTCEAVAAQAAEALGAELSGVDVDDEDAFVTAVAAIRAAGEVAVLMPGPTLGTSSVRAAGATLGTDAAWFAVEATGEAGRTADGQLQVEGRGLGGLSWVIQRLLWGRRWPVERIEYGPGSEQWAELRLPHGEEPAPVVVLVHGGFWRSPWQLDLMDGLSADLAARGMAAWNLEFRRPDRHGWAAATADVAAGIRAVSRAGDRVDAGKVVLLGHSAGAQLVLRAAADGVAPTSSGLALVVSLAGVLDLRATARRGLGDGAVALALGGEPDDVPDVYTASSPLERLPIGVPQLIVQGTADDANLLEMNRRYVAAATAAGDDVEALEAPVDHFAVIDPTSDVWGQVIARL